MQSESTEASPETSSPPYHNDTSSTPQHGYADESFTSPSLSARDEHGGSSRSGSEWSLSPSSGQSPLDSPKGRMSSIDFSVYEADDDNLLDDGNALTARPENEILFKVLKSSHKRGTSDHAPLLDFPEELLFQVLSHLNASDLLTIKLVSRRFNNLVNSPHAWINAFSRYFPGSEALKKTGDIKVSDAPMSELRTEKRAFTRLTAATSWTSEYLLRTKLLRCFARGKPSLPFAAPSQGKPGKGYATFTFSSRLGFGADRLDAKFGNVLDKRSPQFIHGASSHAMCTTSDKRGKFDGWGLHDSLLFRSFEAAHPGTALWGLGTGEIVGVPNVMDLSSNYGVISGEGTPGGNAFYLSAGEKHGRYLSPFSGIAYHHFAVPNISQEEQCVSAAWLAKSPAVPRTSKGLVGMLVGSSCGTVSSYSFGQSGFQQQRFERGELTSRWLLSPGVPIISVVADDSYSEERHSKGRIWAVALNALGEVFVLKTLPILSAVPKRHESQVDRFHELRAWQTGLSATWHVLKPSIRADRNLDIIRPESLPYLPLQVQEKREISSQEVVNQIPSLEQWLLKKPFDLRSLFDGWDMQRRLEVDFGGDDGKGAGESILVFTVGVDEGSPASVTRFVQCALPVGAPTESANPEETTSTSANFEEPTWSFGSVKDSTSDSQHSLSEPERYEFEWRCSNFSFGRNRNIKITTTAIDQSIFALTTYTEDMSQSKRRNNATEQPPSDEHNSFKFPGQRARLFAVGTAAGTVFVWNARATIPGAASVTNEVSPLRVIHTDSPAISSIALTGLCLVHGGSEGLVQVWDVLASTLEPIRTISSRTTLNARRRAVIVAQQNPNLQNANISFYAAGAICLDPDPTILRGIVAIGSLLRYWSYSSADATESMSKSQKRRFNRAAKNFSGSPGESYSSFRRLGLKDLVNEEMTNRAIEQKEKQAEEKERKRVAGRFGVDLLGQDASDEELLAYAKLLSEEEHNSNLAKFSEERLDRDATPDQVEAHKSALSTEDLEKWKFASWEERFDMPTADSRTRTPTSSHAAGNDAEDISRAIELSLQETPSKAPQSSSHVDEFDGDMARAIKLSLGEQDSPKSPSPPAGSASADEDMAKAIELSLRDARGNQQDAMPDRVTRTHSDEDFPALSSSSAATSPMPSWGKGKGKRRM